jgi:hypothetical protein
MERILLDSPGSHVPYKEVVMETPFSIIDHAVAVIDQEPKKVTIPTAKSFVKLACLIAPELPLGFTGGMLVTLNGQTVATYPGRIRRFPRRKS